MVLRARVVVPLLLLLACLITFTISGPPYPAPCLLARQWGAATPEEMWAQIEREGWGEETDPSYTNQWPLEEEAVTPPSLWGPHIFPVSMQVVESESEDEAASEAGSEAESVTLWEDEADSVVILEDVADDLDFLEAVEAVEAAEAIHPLEDASNDVEWLEAVETTPPPEPQADYLTCVHCYAPYPLESVNDNNLCTPCRRQNFLMS